MRAWFSIYTLFLRVMSGGAIRCVATISLGTVLFYKLFSAGLAADSSMITSTPLVTFFLAAFGLFWLVPTNYSWLLMVPMPKRHLVLLQGAVNLTLCLGTFVSYFAIVAITNYALLGNLGLFWNTLHSLSNAFHELSRQWIEGFHHNPYEPMLYAPLFIAGMYSAFFIFGSLRYSNRGRMAFKRLPARGWLIANPKIAMTILALLAFCLLARDYLLSSFGVFIFFIANIALALPGSWTVNLALSGKSAKVSRVFFIFVALLQIGIVYGAAVIKMGRSTEARVQAMLFLGPFGGRPTRPELASLLQSDLSWDSGTKLGNYYLSEFNSGYTLNRGTEQNIDFEKLISSKKSREGIYAAYQYYDPTTLRRADLKTIYRELSKLNNDTDDRKVFLRFVGASVSPEEMRELFASTNKLETTYAILRGRYDQKPIYAEYILSNLSRYSGKTLLLALDTLSILRGSRVTLEEWHTFRNGRSLASIQVKADCEHYSLGKLVDLKPTEAGRLNVCLRQKANKTDPAFLANIEDLGWLEIPLNYAGARVVDAVFQSRK